MRDFLVRVPATTANLGSGFDCLGLALDLWNTTHFSPGEHGINIKIRGEGADHLPQDDTNLIVRALYAWCDELGAPRPKHLSIECGNNIPLNSGMGSSAAAILTGLIAANAWLDTKLEYHEVLRIANIIEGHADNAAAALYGSLAIVLTDHEPMSVTTLPVSPLLCVVILPEFELSTKAARAVLPSQISLRDAIFNIGRTPLVVEGLRSGNLELLATGVQDAIHQPFRLQLIPGAQAAVQAAINLGAPAALSGAGPSVIAFVKENPEFVISAMQQAFHNAGLITRGWVLPVSSQGARLEMGE
jgi:homoserine kinase